MVYKVKQSAPFGSSKLDYNLRGYGSIAISQYNYVSQLIADTVQWLN